MKNEETSSIMRKRPLFIIFLSILFFIGIGLIMYSDDKSYSVQTNNVPSDVSVTASSSEISEVYSEESYVNTLEKNLKDMISSIDGVSNVKVMVTLKSAHEKVYATKSEEKNTPTGSEKSSCVIFRKTKSGDEIPILITEKLPVIGGAAVTCDGVQSSAVKAEIISLVSCALDLPTNKIYVGG